MESGPVPPGSRGRSPRSGCPFEQGHAVGTGLILPVTSIDGEPILLLLVPLHGLLDEIGIVPGADPGARQGLHCQGGRRYLGDRSLWTPDALVCTLRGLSAWARTLPPYAPSSTPAWARWLASWGESCIPRACPEAPSSRSWKTLPVP